MSKKPSEGQREKVALLGCAVETLTLAPFDDNSWDIHCSGQWQPPVARWDQWWELHDIAALPPSFKFHLDWMAAQTKPIMVAKLTNFTPSGVVYDRAGLEKEYGREWFTSTIAWMFAQAIEDGYKEIGLYGVEMSSDKEYFYQRAGIKHMQVEAEKRGIKVTIPPSSELFLEKEPYPFCQETPTAVLLKKYQEKTANERKVLDDQAKAFQIAVAAHDGALQLIEQMILNTYWKG